MARAILLVAAVCALAHVAAACCSGMVMDQLGLNLLENAEGYRSTIYNDAAGHPTICYGHLIVPSDQLNPPLSRAQCQQLLQQDLASAQSCVQNAVTVSLNQNQFSALVDFSFNLGCGALQSSTLLRLLNQGQYSAVPAQLNRWVHAGGRVLPGLVTRRQNEGALWNTPVSGGGGGSGGNPTAAPGGGATSGGAPAGGATTAAPAGGATTAPAGGATTAAPGATTAAPAGGATTAAAPAGGATTAGPGPATTAAPTQAATTAAPTQAATTAAPTQAATTAAPTQGYTTPAATQPATTGGGFLLAEESAQGSSKSSGLSTTETALLAVGVVAGAICVAVGIIVRMRSRRSEDVQLLNAAEL